MSDVPVLSRLPPLPDTQQLASLAATAPSPTSTATPGNVPLPAPASASPASSSTSLPPAATSASTSAQDSTSTSASQTLSASSSSVASAPFSAAAPTEREYYDAPNFTTRGSSVWQSIRLIRGDDDHVHCMRCGKDLKHNRTQARLTGTSNLSRHLRKCKGAPLPGTDNSDERKDNGGAGSDKKRKREEREESEEARGDESEAAVAEAPVENGVARVQRAAQQSESGERIDHHASLLQLQTLHDAALAQLEQTKLQAKTETQPQQQHLPEQLPSSSELRRMMQWHSAAIQRLKRVAARELSDEWKERAGKNFCLCCVDVESEVQLEPCKHVIWCRGCHRDKCAVCGTAVLGKAYVSSESRGEG